jgi:hypothetical protein
MQNGSIIRRVRKKHSDIWQFRWWEKTAEGNRVYRRRVIGTVEQIPDMEGARKAARLLVPDLNAKKASTEPSLMTVAQLCSHFDQRELCMTNTWRSYSTKSIYKVYLKRWVIPKWSEHLLSDIRTIEVESWLRGLPVARSTCAKTAMSCRCCSIMPVDMNSTIATRLGLSVRVRSGDHHRWC